MRRWFDALPIHRKLVAMALFVTTTALLVSIVGLGLIDLWRYRAAAQADVDSMTDVLAENLSAAVAFQDPKDARDLLASVGQRAAVTRACLYLTDETLFAQYVRSGSPRCSASPPDFQSLQVVMGRSLVRRNESVFGAVLVERELPDLAERIGVTVFSGSIMLVLAAALAYGLSHRLHLTVSRPIAKLAAAARAIGHEERFARPEIEAGSDEVGDLVRAFDEMVTRIRDARAELLRSNDLLRHEVEERKRMEAERETLLARERQASRLKDEFLAAVSHELRTPLNAIVGWVQVLGSRTPTDETLHKALPSLSRNAQALTHVIEDLIDISRVATGKLHLELGAVDLRTVVEAAVEITAPAARAKQVTVRTRVPSEPCLVRGDSNRLQQVVWNLLSNAVKFTPAQGQVTVVLLEEDRSYTVSVTDTGIGIEPEFLPRVFERFLQADGSMTRQHGGLGLGLAIVKELIELHGGSVRATSPGRNGGARFTVQLPRMEAGDVESARRTSPADVARWPSLEGVRVLAVDDNRDALDVLSAALTRAGAQVEAVTSGIDAVAAWQRRPADVLLCDLAMPQMDGYDVLDRIRRLDAGAGRQLRAIAVTAHASEAHHLRTRRAGFQHHIAKPFDAAQLVKAVAAALERT
jgi:signal transduction histidine kinase/CheY-like chemotaxis protein